jgi:hypothetical protein
MRTDWSPRVYELEKILEPYFDNKNGGLKPDAPKEMQELYEEGSVK